MQSQILLGKRLPPKCSPRTAPQCSVRSVQLSSRSQRRCAATNSNTSLADPFAPERFECGEDDDECIAVRAELIEVIKTTESGDIDDMLLYDTSKVSLGEARQLLAAHGGR